LSSRIEIDEGRLWGNSVSNRLCYPSEIEDCFHSDGFEASYGLRVEDNPSILNIPVVSSVLAESWVLGVDIHVPTLDKVFAESVERLKGEYEKIYDRKFSSKLVVDEAVENHVESEGTAVYFSGGLDSTYSTLTNLALNPLAIMVFGYDLYLNGEAGNKIKEKWREAYTKFADWAGFQITFVHTNSRWLVDEDRVSQRMGGFHAGLSYWDAIRHAVCLMGLAAPLSLKRFNRLHVAANGAEFKEATRAHPYGSASNLNTLIKWGDLETVWDGPIYRFQKAEKIKEWLNSGQTMLRPCYKPLLDFNCNECEKCLRTIFQLIVAGVDPEKCGMKVSRDTWGLLRGNIEGGVKRRLIQTQWLPLQRHIREFGVTVPRSGVGFINWFMDIDLEEYAVG